jgi:hypothetical protein
MNAKKEQVNQLLYERKNFWKEASAEEIKKAFDFAVPYKDFLTNAKQKERPLSGLKNCLRLINLKHFSAKQNKKVYSIFRIRPLLWLCWVQNL